MHATLSTTLYTSTGQHNGFKHFFKIELLFDVTYLPWSKLPSSVLLSSVLVAVPSNIHWKLIIQIELVSFSAGHVTKLSDLICSNSSKLLSGKIGPQRAEDWINLVFNLQCSCCSIYRKINLQPCKRRSNIYSFILSFNNKQNGL